MASDFIMEGVFSYPGRSRMTFSELRKIVEARKTDFTIHKGEKYLCQVLVDGSDKWTFRAIPEMHKICLKYDLYPEC